MKCPRCNADVQAQDGVCRNCGFSAAFLHCLLGNQWVKLERITDVAHCLRLEDSRRVEVILDDFERCFPQVFFAAYLGVLPSKLSVSEVGFWLLNHGAFNTPSIHRRNDFGIVLVIDPAVRTACLTLGYAIERVFSAKAVQRILREAGGLLARRAFGMAVEKACLRCGALLKKNSRKGDWEPVPSSAKGTTHDMGLAPLRAGHHRPTSRPLAGFSQEPKK